MDYVLFSLEVTRVSQKFCNILVRASLQCVYHMIEAVQVAVEDTHTVIGSIVVVGALTHGVAQSAGAVEYTDCTSAEG